VHCAALGQDYYGCTESVGCSLASYVCICVDDCKWTSEHATVGMHAQVQIGRLIAAPSDQDTKTDRLSFRLFPALHPCLDASLIGDVTAWLELLKSFSTIALFMRSLNWTLVKPLLRPFNCHGAYLVYNPTCYMFALVELPFGMRVKNTGHAPLADNPSKAIDSCVTRSA
jgi:hypothetical protein